MYPSDGFIASSAAALSLFVDASCGCLSGSLGVWGGGGGVWGGGVRGVGLNPRVAGVHRRDAPAGEAGV
uniref:Uncharacterized protein n=1 Tax=Triticum urartu TaxID=4572 RepID=A0A8R7UF29_TRIUA